MITPPGVFHWGFNISRCINEAWNFTTQGWSKNSTDKSYCTCSMNGDKSMRLKFYKKKAGVYQARISTGRLVLHL